MPPTRTATAGRVISVAARLRRVLILLAVLLILGGGSFHGVLTGLRTARAERARMVELVALSAAQVRGAGAVAPFASLGGSGSRAHPRLVRRPGLGGTYGSGPARPSERERVGGDRCRGDGRVPLAGRCRCARPRAAVRRDQTG
jgi:hypothetical protein